MKRWVSTLFLVCVVLLSAPLSFSSKPATGPIVAVQYVTAQNTPPGVPAGSGIATNPAQATPAAEECGWGCKNIVRPFFSTTISAIVSLTGGLLWMTGWLFDKVIKEVGANAGTWIKYLDPAIIPIWQFFRDLSSILLIGTFIFIAIRTILGVGGSSNKQLTIKVIIVALLINFSLFFTQAAIDVTNFFAFQFYKNISTLQVNNGETSTIQEVGVSERFATSMGVSTFANIFSDTKQRLNNAAGNSGSLGSIGNMVLQGVGLSALYAGAAILFGWGVYLLVARAIILVTLMTLSSLAFIAYVVPKLEEYYDQWFENLWKNAVFAPLLMALLWASIMITDTLVGAVGQRPPGEIFGNPSKEGVGMLLNYVFVLGFMYASLYLARNIAGKSGPVLSWLTKVPRTRMLAGTPIAAWVNLRQGKVQERQRDKAYKDYTDAKSNVATAYAQLAKRPRDTNLQNAYKDALAKQEAMKKSLDNPASVGKFNTALAKIAGGLGGKVQKPEGEKLITSVNKKEKEQKDAAGEAAKLVRDSRKEEKAAAEQQKQSERNTQEIVQAVKSQREDTEKQIKLQQQTVEGLKEQRELAEKIVNTTDPNAYVTVPGRGSVRRGTLTEEQLRSSKQVIENAKQQSDLLSKLVEKRDSITVESETQKRAISSEKAAKEEAARQASEVSLLKQIAKLRGKELDTVGVKEAQRIVKLEDRDYQKEQNRANSARYRQEQLDAVKSLKEEKKAEDKK